MTTTVSSRGQLVVPSALRKKYGLRNHAKVAWVELDQGLLLVPAGPEAVRDSRGFLKGSGASTKLLLRMRQEERQREEKKLRVWLKPWQ